MIICYYRLLIFCKVKEKGALLSTSHGFFCFFKYCIDSYSQNITKKCFYCLYNNDGMDYKALITNCLYEIFKRNTLSEICCKKTWSQSIKKLYLQKHY